MQLTKNAEKISASLGLGHAWAGAILLPLATSLPELVTSLRAALINAPNLAGGNVYGSILFNLTLIALIDLVQGRVLVCDVKNSYSDRLFSMLILIVSILGFVLALPYRLMVGLDSIAILVVYLLGSGMIMGLESRRSRQAKGSVPVGRKKSFIAAFLFLLARWLLSWPYQPDGYG